MANTAQQVEEKVIQAGSAVKTGLRLERYFTQAGGSPYDEVEWESRTATILNEKGKVVFEQANVEIPKSWSYMATNVVVSKYFRGSLGSPERERSVTYCSNGRIYPRLPRVIETNKASVRAIRTAYAVVRERLRVCCIIGTFHFHSPVD